MEHPKIGNEIIISDLIKSIGEYYTGNRLDLIKIAEKIYEIGFESGFNQGVLFYEAKK